MTAGSLLLDVEWLVISPPLSPSLCVLDHAFIVHSGVTGGGGATVVASAAKSGVTFQKWVAMMSDEVYRFLLVTAFMIQVTCVSFIPFVGSTLVFMHLCWLYSLYSFESVNTFTHKNVHGSITPDAMLIHCFADMLVPHSSLSLRLLLLLLDRCLDTSGVFKDGP